MTEANISTEPSERNRRKGPAPAIVPAILPDGITVSGQLTQVTMTAPTDGMIGAVNDPMEDRRRMAVLYGDGGPYIVQDLGTLSQTLTAYSHFPSCHFLSLPEAVVPHEWYRKEAFNCFTHENPWYRLPWFRENVLRWVEHLPAPSETIPGNLAYYQTPAKRARNIRTPIKPGRYLKKYFGDVLTEEQIHEAALVWQNHFALRKVTITQDADEIERVYTGAYLGSCMHFGRGEHQGDEHPARVYGGPDLGIAYIGETDSADARCLVWPEKKIYYPKWYGDGPRLEAALKAEGYEAGYEEDFDGARIQRIEHGRGAFVVPYVDVCDEAEDDGDYLILGGYGVYLRNTSGVSNELAECEDCGYREDPDEMSWVYISGSESRVCSSCADDHYFRCDQTGDLHHVDDRAPTPDDYDLSQYAADRYDHRWFYCEKTELYYPYRDYNEVTLIEGETCEEDYAEEHGWQCEYREEWSLDFGARVTLTDGSVVHQDSLHDFGFDQWMKDRDASLGTIPHPDQTELDLPVAA